MRKVCLLLVLVALASAAAAPPLAAQRSKDGENRQVIIINARSSPLMRLYGARTTIDEWEENILTKPIGPGERIVINFDDGSGSCRFDIRAIFKDRQMAQTWSFNVCAESEWTITD